MIDEYQAPTEAEIANRLQLADRIPAPILKRIRFMKEWKEPDNFRTMPNKARLELTKTLDHRLLLPGPTTKCCWVWFGSYHRETGIAWCNNKYVQRQLYEIFHGPAHGKRLTNHFSKSPSDVNPWKCFTGMPGYLNHINERKENNYHDDLAKFKGNLNPQKVAECVAFIQEGGYKDMGFKPTEIRNFLIKEFDPPTIEESLKQLGMQD